ncbi:DUF4097 family beta strand repeat-containing protein [Nakamurella deserti]|uniref:DUF4097 family beta strand repeat-containing protein n=1 Tax=Nakamurella deserti TaxID=2164074 RepID=UPI000DBE871B|nr:DUF4097 family beta strand repeat-containing protein [Nakamurella deserti]
MHHYLTPEPITCEVRNAAGAVTVELTDTSMTTVDVITADDAPGGFLDDVIRSVSGWTPAEQPAPGPSDDATEDVLVSFDNGKLIVDSEPARRRWHSGFIVRITAPAGSGVRARTESAAVGITGRAERIEVKTASGAVAVGRADGRAMVRTVSGDIDIRDASRGTVDLAAVSGSLHVGIHAGVAAKVELTTVSGTARSTLPVVEHLEGSSLTVKGRTVSGAVSLAAADAGPSDG